VSNTRGSGNNTSDTLRVLCIGDVVGPIGCTTFQRNIDRICREHRIDVVIVNGENSGPRGRGITSRIVKFFKHNAADVITTGNHVWSEREIYDHLPQLPYLLRPANYPSDCPGSGVHVFACRTGQTVAVINLQGRIFMRDHVSCPFKAAESLLTFVKAQTDIIIVDFHAEATSEKIGLAHFLDGKVSAVVGTHTHVQTADERVLPGGTAFISDLGMVGARDSMLGMKKEPILQHFLTQMPVRFVVETEAPAIMCGACIEIDTKTGHARSIERIRLEDNDVSVDVNQ